MKETREIPASYHPLIRAWKWWFTPRATDPTLVYRERALRILLPITILLRILGTLQAYSGAPDLPKPYAPEWMYLVFFIVPILFSIYFLAQQKVNAAGAFFLLHWYLVDMLSLPAEGYWYPGYQISIILQAVIGTLVLPSRAILPFILFQLTTIGMWGNWLDVHYYDPPLLSTGKPVTVFWRAFSTLAAQEIIIMLIVRYLRLELEKYSHLRQVTINQLETEIAERAKVELALQRSEDMYRRAIDAAGAVPYILGEGMHNFTFIGEGILQMTGYSASEMTSDIWHSLVQEGIPRGKLAHLTYEEADRLTNEDHSILWECDFRIRTRDGKTRWIADTSVKGFDEKGAHLVAIGIKQDITERKHAEELQDNLIRELEQRNAELERLAYTLSHELKSPLITIRGFLGFVREDALRGNINRLESDLRRITEGSDKMLRLINELIELMGIGRIIHETKAIPLRTLVAEAVELVHEGIMKKNISVHIVDDLPSVHGDHQRLVEVLQNLLENSIKFMGDQPEPKIEIGQRSEQGAAPIFYVRDNGTGIEPRFHERIFGIFHKLDAKSEGTGIGLALVKRIIEVHGGRIWVESDGIGKGSTFCFTIPVMENKT